MLSQDQRIVDEELLSEGKSDNGGWTRPQLKILGVAWPPKKGWKKRMVRKRRVIPVEDAARFVALRGARKPAIDRQP